MKDKDGDIDLKIPLPSVNDKKLGLYLCQLALAQVFLQSEIRKEGAVRQYYLEGVLRAEMTVDLQKNVPDGPFRLWYKDGKHIWVTGSYCNGKMIADWMIYRPDGSVIK